MRTYKNFLFIGLLFWTFGGMAQVISNFNDTTTQGWIQEGDGSVNWSADGFPGGALRINDDASGDINYAIAPSSFLGDWSLASASDTLKCNVYYDQLSGTVFPETAYFFQISGPGGKAQAIVPNPIPVELTWENRKVSLDVSDWLVISGDWNALLNQVTEVRIYSEFVTGDEFVLLDNIELSISPPNLEQAQFQCSDFEDDNFDGWTFTNASGTVDTDDGNPGTAIRISDVSGPIGRGIAPPKFLGDWSALDGTGIIGYDFRVLSGTTFVTDVEKNLIIISGPAGSAQYDGDLSVISAGIGAYSRIETTLDESNWIVNSGTWAGILADVTSVDIRLEFINGIETAFLDNFCLGNPCTRAPTGLADVVGPTGVTVSWNSELNQGAIGYRIGGKPEGAASFAFVKVPAPNTSLFVSNSKLIADTTYAWRVEAVCIIDGSIRTAVSSDTFYVPPFLRLSKPQIEVKVYPNPTQSFLYIESVDLARLELFDLQGKLILNQKDTRVLNLSTMPNGMYILRITDIHGGQALRPVTIN